MGNVKHRNEDGTWSVVVREGGGASGTGSDPNAVKYTEQELTDAQKKQARDNIDAERIHISDTEPDDDTVNVWIDTSDDSSEETLDLSELTAVVNDNTERITNLETSFLDGCDEIVGGITAFGVTPESNSPADIKTAIGKVYNEGYFDAQVGTATSADVLTGKTYTSAEGVLLDGTMPNNGALNWSPSSSTSYTVPEGYYSGGTLSSANAYNAGKTAGTTTLGSGQGILVANTTNLRSPASSGSTNLGTIWSWENTYGAGKIYMYAKCTSGSSSYCYTYININGSQVHSSDGGTYIGQGVAISNNGAVSVACQARAGMGAFMVIFIKN